MSLCSWRSEIHWRVNEPPHSRNLIKLMTECSWKMCRGKRTQQFSFVINQRGLWDRTIWCRRLIIGCWKTRQLGIKPHEVREDGAACWRNGCLISRHTLTSWLLHSCWHQDLNILQPFDGEIQRCKSHQGSQTKTQRWCLHLFNWPSVALPLPPFSSSSLFHTTLTPAGMWRFLFDISLFFHSNSHWCCCFFLKNWLPVFLRTFVLFLSLLLFFLPFLFPSSCLHPLSIIHPSSQVVFIDAPDASVSLLHWSLAHACFRLGSLLFILHFSTSPPLPPHPCRLQFFLFISLWDGFTFGILHAHDSSFLPAILFFTSTVVSPSTSFHFILFWSLCCHPWLSRSLHPSSTCPLLHENQRLLFLHHPHNLPSGVLGLFILYARFIL